MMNCCQYLFDIGDHCHENVLGVKHRGYVQGVSSAMAGFEVQSCMIASVYNFSRVSTTVLVLLCHVLELSSKQFRFDYPSAPFSQHLAPHYAY